MTDTHNALTTIARADLATTAAPQRGPVMHPAQKAAIVLVSLGPENASQILTELGEDRLKRFVKTLHNMPEVSARMTEEVIGEFLHKLEDSSSVAGGAEGAHRFLSAALDDDRATKLINEVTAASRPVWSVLADVDDEQIAAWLRGEHPQVAAIALSRLAPVKAARVLEKFDDDERQDVVLRMSSAAAAEGSVAERIGEAISRDFLPKVRKNASRKDPADLIAGVMNHVTGDVRDRLLEQMNGTAPDLTGAVRKKMFTFEDIPTRLSSRDVGLVLRQVEESTLLVALRVSSEKNPDLLEFIFSAIPKRLGERLREEMGEIDPPSKRAGEAAQGEITAAITALRDSGALKFLSTESEEDE